MNNKYRILIEVICDECKGEGEIAGNNYDDVKPCTDCEQTGYMHEHKTLKELKELLAKEK